MSEDGWTIVEPPGASPHSQLRFDEPEFQGESSSLSSPKSHKNPAGHTESGSIHGEARFDQPQVTSPGDSTAAHSVPERGRVSPVDKSKDECGPSVPPVFNGMAGTRPVDERSSGGYSGLTGIASCQCGEKYSVLEISFCSYPIDEERTRFAFKCFNDGCGKASYVDVLFRNMEYVSAPAVSNSAGPPLRPLRYEDGDASLKEKEKEIEDGVSRMALDKKKFGVSNFGPMKSV